MIGALISFELRRRLTMLSTYIFAALLFAGSVFSMLASAGAFKAISVSSGPERVHANSPHQLYGMMGGLGLLALFLVAAIFGQAVHQDFGHRTWMLIFSKNVKKAPYLSGRFLGALVFSALLFLTIPLGFWSAAAVMSFVDPSKLGPNGPAGYAWAYLIGILPMLFFCGVIFFGLAALSRQMAPVYVGMVVVVLGYNIVGSAIGDVDNRTLASILDPLGFSAYSVVTRYWTAIEKNTQLVPLTGLFLVNRLLWTGIAAALFAGTVALFRTRVDELGGKKAKRDDDEDADHSALEVAAITAKPTTAGWVVAMLHQSWIGARTIFRSPVYWSFIFAGTAILVVAIMVAPDMYGTSTYAVTYKMLDLAGGAFALFGIIVITFYAGELVWEERDQGLADIIDATRVPTWVGFFSKFLALSLVVLTLQATIGLAALGAQLAQGFTRIELDVYAVELLFYGWLKDLPLVALAITLQVVVNHKYLGHGVMVLYYVLRIVLDYLGIEEKLVLFGSEPSVMFSDMNRWGHALNKVLVYRGYWYLVCAVLLTLALGLFVRGREASWKARSRALRQRASLPWFVVLGLSAAGVVGLGAFIYIQEHVARPYFTQKQLERDQADYEKTYKATWEEKAQPRIVDADVMFDLFPEEKVPRAVLTGRLILENKTNEPIGEVLVSLPDDAKVRVLSVGTSTSPKEYDGRLSVRIFALEPAMQPGDKRTLTFDLEYFSDPWRHGTMRRDVVKNGSFMNSANVPSIGYSKNYELSQDSDRKQYGLPDRERMPDREDEKALRNNYISSDADFIRFAATVGAPADQVAVAPGYVESEWTKDGRRYRRFVMDSPILNFYAVLSAHYEIRRAKWNDVDLEVYFHRDHTYNVDGMLEGMRHALEYSSAAFGPYQHRQARIFEFPRYSSFAQAFPNTIPYSEGIGFIARVRPDSDKDVDYPYWVTAHEIAHQWWAHQVTGAYAKGATVMSESLAQYTAMMVMRQKYGPEKMRRFLKYELDKYLMGRATESKKEQPLALNENQPYIHYQKGGMVMYALADYIGEERVNRALKNFLAANQYKGPPYPTSKELVSALRAETPPEFGSIIDDWFETVTIYDNRAKSATVTKTATGKWHVRMEVEAKKYRVNEKDEQTAVDFEDLLPIGALAENGNGLFIDKRKVKNGSSTIEFELDEKPARVGLDPLNLLIDRTSSDNTVVPTEEPSA